MNENIEKVLAVLDGFRMSDEMTYSAYSVLHDEISLLDNLLKAQEPGWISVKDRLPEKPGRYLVCAKEGERETHRTIAPFQRAFHLTGRMAYWKVTHWMPLPEPPKEE